MKIALFAPWPPQRSGIADYSYRLRPGCCKRTSTWKSLLRQPRRRRSRAARFIRSPRIRALVWGGDALPVFQLGNNVMFHAFQPAALARLGGLVSCTIRCCITFTWTARSLPASAATGKTSNAGTDPAVARACRRLLTLGAPPWSNEAVTAIPFFEPYLQFADAVLVHSHSALRTIHSRMPEQRGYCLPQSYPLDPPPRRPFASPDRPLRIGVFGWVEPHKRVDHDPGRDRRASPSPASKSASIFAVRQAR